MTKENRIIQVTLLLENDQWQVKVLKEFAPEYGGGSTVFCEEAGPSIHHALNVARGMVTVSPSRNPESKD
jgi:hypothetical protein